MVLISAGTLAQFHIKGFHFPRYWYFSVAKWSQRFLLHIYNSMKSEFRWRVYLSWTLWVSPSPPISSFIISLPLVAIYLAPFASCLPYLAITFLDIAWDKSCMIYSSEKIQNLAVSLAETINAWHGPLSQTRSLLLLLFLFSSFCPSSLILLSSSSSLSIFSSSSSL